MKKDSAKKASVDNQQKNVKRGIIVDNQQNGGIRLSNNAIALIAIIFIITSCVLNYAIYKSAGIKQEAVGKVVSQANIGLCLNARPILSEDCLDGAGIGVKYYCRLNYTDRDNVSITFTDNTSIFNINNAGEIDFTPQAGDNGTYIIEINIDDGSGCGNSKDSIDMFLRVSYCVEPIWSEFENNITTNFSNYDCWNALADVTIGIPHKGTINYSGKTLDLNGVDLNASIDILYNNITVYSELLYNINKTSENTIFNLSLTNPAIMRDAVRCDEPFCNRTSYLNGDLIFRVSYFTSYHAKEGVSLATWDSTDNYTTYVKSYVNYYADYKYENSSSVLDGNCKVKINVSGGDYSQYYDMTYNSSSELFEYAYYFELSSQGNRSYFVLCNNTDGFEINITSNYTITNRNPVRVSDMPNETWSEDTSLHGRDLDDYFSDPDEDILNFTNTPVENIQVIIDNTTHRITLIPDEDFHGTRYIVYFAEDPYGGTAESNIVTLTVFDVVEPIPGPEEPEEERLIPSGGGGGITRTDCVELWDCSKWGPCLPSGIATRNCDDLAKCDTETRKPKMIKTCTYIPTCFDLIKNGDEKGVDCGGPCKPCPTCTDGIQNGGEDGIDCGGLCKPCPTCTDGIQNQGEEEIDCGGPCKPCPTCFDEIQNQGEEGIDCGGPCKRKCEILPEVEIPAIMSLIKFISFDRALLLIIILLLLLLFIFRKRLKQLLVESKAYRKKLSERAKERERQKRIETVKNAGEVAIKALVDVKEKYNKAEFKDANDVFANTLNAYIRNTFNVPIPFTKQLLMAALKKAGVKDEIASKFTDFCSSLERKRYAGKTLSKGELKNCIKSFEVLTKKITLLLIARKEKSKNEKLEGFIKETHVLLRQDNLDMAKISYGNAMSTYKLLSKKEKKAAYPKLKRLYDKYNKLRQTKTKIAAEKLKKTTLLILVVFAFSLLLFFFSDATKTGFVIFEQYDELTIRDIPSQNLVADKEFQYNVVVKGHEGKLHYADNSNLFVISQDGNIRFTPTVEDIGRHTAVIIVEDSTGMFRATHFEINIFENKQKLEEHLNEEQE